MSEPTDNSDGTQTVLCLEIRSDIDGCCNVAVYEVCEEGTAVFEVPLAGPRTGLWLLSLPSGERVRIAVDCGELTVAAPHGTKAEDLHDVTRWRLTGREASILALLRDGKTNNEIAAKLEVSRATVKWHVHNLFAKTGAFSHEELLRLALRYDAPASEDEESGGDASASARPAKTWF